MNRRHFLRSTATLGTGLAWHPIAHGKAPADMARMKAGHQHHSSDADLRVLAALGVRHICSALPSRTLDEAWSVAGLSRLRDRVEKYGIRLEMVPLPLSGLAPAGSDTEEGLLREVPEGRPLPPTSS